MLDRAARARVVPFALYMAFVVLADVLSAAGLDAQALRWLYPVKIAAVLGALWHWRREYSELAWRPPGAAGIALALGAGVLVWWLWIALDAPWMVVGAPAGFVPLTGGRPDWLLIAVRLAGAALVVPVMEELFWRSFLLRRLMAGRFLAVDPGRLAAVPVVVTVLLFGVEHNQWLAGMVAGAVYTALYWHGRNLWLPVLAHAVTNAVLGGWVLATANWTYW